MCEYAFRRKKVAIASAWSACALVVVAAVTLLMPVGEKIHSIGSTYQRTQIELDNIAVGFKAAISSGVMIKKGLYNFTIEEASLLSSVNGYTPDSKILSLKEREFRDVWNNEVIINIESIGDNKSIEIEVLTYGKNRENDMGNKDDILVKKIIK